MVYWVKSLVPMLMQVDERHGGAGMEREGGHLGHGADLEPRGQIVRTAHPTSVAASASRRAGGPELVDGRDHREEHGDRVLHPELARAPGAVV